MTLLPRVILCFLCACMVTACLGDIYTNTSHSMEPTMMEGDRFTIYPLVLSELERGDLVLYANPGNEEEFHAKRLIGLPGEKVEIKDGKVYINDMPLAEDYVVNSAPPTPLYGPVVMGKDEYFILGDNRPASYDSRVHGPIPGRLIQGEIVIQE